MRHEPPPRRWEDEPEWLKDMRDIEKRITLQVDRYVRLRRWDRLLWFVAGMGGYWFGVGIVVLLKWRLGVPQ